MLYKGSVVVSFLKIDKLEIIFPGNAKNSEKLKGIEDVFQQVSKKLFSQVSYFEPILKTASIMRMVFNDVSLPIDIAGGEFRVDGAFASEFNNLALEKGVPLVSVAEQVDIASLMANSREALKNRKLIVTPQWS
jgi:hypothetical protein